MQHELSDAPSIVLGPRYAAAVEYASRMHADQVRKGSTIPYICHPLAVSALVLEAGGDEDLAIAALLHDVAEDCGGEPVLAEIEEMFGPRVEHIVRACSDSLVMDPSAKAPWRERKEKHLTELADADADVILVSAADKVHNARALRTDLDLHGISATDRFNAPPDEIVWYHESMLAVLTDRQAPPVLLDQLRVAVTALVGLIHRNPLHGNLDEI